MSLERQPGRQCPGQLGFPAGCSALSCNPLARCTAQQRSGTRCLLCKRVGDTPMPREIDDIGWNIVGNPSVQIIRATRGSSAWLVVAMVSGRMVDPRWPIIACGEKREAIDLAFKRARQIVPGRSVKAWPGDDSAWHCGDLMIWVADPNE